MAMDIDKELAAAVAEKGDYVGRVLCEKALLRRILRSRSMRDFKAFFERFYDDNRVFLGLDGFPSLFGPWWMSRFEPEHIFWIYNHLLNELDSSKAFEKFLADKRIGAPRRAFFYHAVFNVCRRVTFRRGGIVRLPRFWWDNRQVWREYVGFVGVKSPDAFIRRLALYPTPGYRVSDVIATAMEKDSVSLVEMNRQLENRRLGDSFMQSLIRADAGRCFVYMLANNPERVFVMRSPEEWLFTVCRHAREGLAVAAAAELERQFPGLVARARDPWGNTPLWNTFVNPEPTGKLRAELIRLGCDPDAENELGLSYRLLKDNEPAALLGPLSTAAVRARQLSGAPPFGGGSAK